MRDASRRVVGRELSRVWPVEVREMSLKSLEVGELLTLVSLEKRDSSSWVSLDSNEVSFVYDRVDASPSSLEVGADRVDSSPFLAPRGVEDGVEVGVWAGEVRAVAVGVMSEVSFHSPRLFSMNL